MLNVYELVISTLGTLINGNKSYVPKNYVIDSRLAVKNDFFVPIIGEKTDGHLYILDCVKSGICGYFISKNLKEKENIEKESIKINKDIIIIEVEDTSKALIDSARYNRNKHIDIPVIAITGSVGKTSTRQIIASVLKTNKNVLVTEKNYNSLIGLPIMCLKIDSQDICVLEVGIDKFSEMEILSDILKPDIACFTVIGTSHIGTLKSRDNIFKEKFKLTNNLKGIKKVLINGDDDKLNEVNYNNFEVIKVLDSDIKELKSYDNKVTFKTKIYEEDCIVVLNQIGIHNAKNALFAIKIGEIFNIPKEDIIKGINEYENFQGRLNIDSINGVKIVDDTYNASFESIKSGLLTIFGISSKRKIIALGDVFDLGDMSKTVHIQIANLLKEEKSKFDMVFLSGDAMKDTYCKIKDDINCMYFENKDDIVMYLKDYLKDGDLIYFKASNAMKYTKIVSDLKEILNKN